MVCHPTRSLAVDLLSYATLTQITDKPRKNAPEKSLENTTAPAITFSERAPELWRRRRLFSVFAPFCRCLHCTFHGNLGI